MGFISATIQLTDLMTGPLTNITNALNMTISTFETMQAACGSAIDNADFQGIRDEIALANAGLNEMEQNIQNNVNGQQRHNRAMGEGRTAAEGLLGTLKKMVGTYLTIQGVQKTLGLSDTYTQTEARLNLMKDEGQTVEELEQKIFASAQRSRSLYSTTADVVAKLGQRAGDAFATSDETIQFAENLNKQFVIAGASQQEVASASLQLTQALGSGVLRGEELNAVFEAAPNVIQTIADYMDVPIGSIRGMASEGQITADIVKNAMLSATDRINEEFEAMPLTFGQVSASLKNQALMAFSPFLQQLNGIANSAQFAGFVDGLVGGLMLVAFVASGVLGLMTSAGSLIADNWSWLAPIIYGVAGALAVYYGWQAGVIAVTKLSQGAHVALAAAEMAHAAVTGKLNQTRAAAIASQYGLNAAMYACPVTWIVIAIIGLIAVVYAAVAAFNKLAGTSYSVTGAIAGAVSWMVAMIHNMLVGLANGAVQIFFSILNPIVSMIEWVLNVAQGGFDSFGAAVANLIGQLISQLLSLAKIASKVFDAITGRDLTGSLTNLQDQVLSWGKNENAITTSREAPAIFERWDLTDAFDKGYTWGENMESSIADRFKLDIDDAYTKTGSGTVADYIASTADNTSAIADSVDISNENLKYLRDLAEMEAVNRFTTAEIKVEQTNYNSVNSGMDIDGMVTQFTDGMNEAIEQAAEGVHK